MARKLSDEEVKERVKIKNPNLKIIKVGQTSQEPCICECNICKGTFEWKRELLLDSQKCSCKICNGSICVEGINDLATTAPEFIKYFVNKELTKKYTKGSKVKVKLKCPDCNYEKEQRISDLINRGFSCPKCKGNISFPNRMSYAILEQLPIENWHTEYSPKWANGYRYDNYFEYQNKKYIIEMDGEFHYKDNTLARTELKEQQQIDNEKDSLAQQQGIEIIRINCFDTSIEKIKEEFFNSKLNQIFDLNNIKWNICGQQAVSNLISEVCKYYMENKYIITQKEIADKFHISVDTIRVYLKQGAACGLCDYSNEEARYNSIYLTAQAKRSNPKNEFIAFSPEGKELGHFFTNVDCVEYMNKIQSEHIFTTKNISAVLNGHRGSVWGYKFKRINR